MRWTDIIRNLWHFITKNWPFTCFLSVTLKNRRKKLAILTKRNCRGRVPRSVWYRWPFGYCDRTVIFTSMSLRGAAQIAATRQSVLLNITYYQWQSIDATFWITDCHTSMHAGSQGHRNLIAVLTIAKKRAEARSLVIPHPPTLSVSWSCGAFGILMADRQTSS